MEKCSKYLDVKSFQYELGYPPEDLMNGNNEIIQIDKLKDDLINKELSHHEGFTIYESYTNKEIMDFQKDRLQHDFDLMLLTRKDSNFLIENMSMLFRTKFFALVFSDSKNTCEFYHIQKQPKEAAKDDKDLCVF